MSSPTLIILRGYPGSGKTTIGKLLENDGQGLFIDHNAILTFIAGIVGNDDGIYKNIHDLEIAMTHKLLSEGRSTVVARGFGKQSSIDPYLGIAAKTKARTYIIRLEATTSTLSKRVTADERKRDFNPTTTKAALLKWMKGSPLENVQNEYVIDADQPIQDVLKEIKTLL